MPCSRHNASPAMEQEQEIKPHPNTANHNDVWAEFERDGRVSTKVTLDFPAIQPEDVVRLVVISDTHNHLGTLIPHIPNGDILIHCGDFSRNGTIEQILKFNREMARLTHKHKIVIAGNHEISFDDAALKPRATLKENADAIRKQLKEEAALLGDKRHKDLMEGFTYLEGQSITLHGYKFWGGPWQPYYAGMAFNEKRGQILLDHWNTIPGDTEILLTHGPPLGHGDLSHRGTHEGCVELLNTVEKRLKPIYHCFGHIHEGYGVSTNGVTTFVNAALCDLNWQPANTAHIIDLPKKPPDHDSSMIPNS